MEWLETNGLGGFASSTDIGLNTRRYHGLLVAATKPPGGRLVMLSKLEETLVIGDQRYELSANRYPGVIHPQGHRFLTGFRLDPFPIFTYTAGDVSIEKRVFMVHGENTTVVEYEVLSGGDCVLKLRPLIAFRDFHSTTHRNDAFNAAIDVTPGMVRLAPYGDMPPLYLSHDQADIESTGFWYENFEYSREQERGLDYREDLFNPLLMTFSLKRGAEASVVASLDPRPASEVPALRGREIRRRAHIVACAPSSEPLVRSLTAAADQFIVSWGELKTVIAGYHWFGEWGRDTMIALPGLTLVTGRAEIAKSILLAYASSIDQGMLPNRYPEHGETPDYNTVDATLWFFEAIRALLQYTNEYEFVREHLYDKLKDIIDWHLKGTRYGIRVDDDGLLHAGCPGVQLTWMDSKIGDWVVTPRHGKPVEIQALWYNALQIMADLADGGFYRELADKTRDSFNRKFWNASEGCLYDVIDGNNADGSIRPNQIFAVSLAHSILEHDRAESVVEVVERELLTPVGLRSLSPRDLRYKPHYGGGVWDRDSSYHQGTVWPWLMGSFITAYMRVHDGSETARTQAMAWLAGLGPGHISEVADGDAPHGPGGCIAQAWNVAELLRAAVELDPRPARNEDGLAGDPTRVIRSEKRNGRGDVLGAASST